MTLFLRWAISDDSSGRLDASVGLCAQTWQGGLAADTADGGTGPELHVREREGVLRPAVYEVRWMGPCSAGLAAGIISRLAMLYYYYALWAQGLCLQCMAWVHVLLTPGSTALAPICAHARRLIGAAAELLQQSVPQTIQETGVHFPTYAEELVRGTGGINQHPPISCLVIQHHMLDGCSHLSTQSGCMLKTTGNKRATGGRNLCMEA